MKLKPTISNIKIARKNEPFSFRLHSSNGFRNARNACNRKQLIDKLELKQV